MTCTRNFVAPALLLQALTHLACLAHEKPYDVTPANQVGTQAPDTGLKLGQTAPDATVIDASGARVQLASLTEKRPTLLVFYRGGWCPPCNYQIHALSLRDREFEQRGVQILGISVDDRAHAAATHEEYKTPFPLLSDPDLSAHRAFNVVDEIGGMTTFMLARMGVDLEERSGREHHDVAVPALFLLDEKRVLRWAHTDPDYSTRPSVDQLLAAIDRAELRPTQAPAPSGPPAESGSSLATAPTEDARPTTR